MSRAELVTLPVATDLRTACRALQIGERLGYEMAGKGEFPCRLLRVGRQWRAVVVGPDGLLAALGIEQPPGSAAS
jgi:hypothetical protein